MARVRERFAWSIVLVLGLLVVLAVTGVAEGGPLDPQGSPAPTGKTLDEIPGSWSRKLPANDGAPGPNPPAGCNSTRFQCVLESNRGVLDRETGLVWYRDADFASDGSWYTIMNNCRTFAGLTGTRGWRLPSVEEFLTLIDTNTGTIPAGHPFLDVQPGSYWTATTSPDNATQAYAVDPNTSAVGTNSDKSNVLHMWCVRGAPVGDGS